MSLNVLKTLKNRQNTQRDRPTDGPTDWPTDQPTDRETNRVERTRLKSYFRRFCWRKSQKKKNRKKFGLAFDSGFKSFLDAPGKKSPIHLSLQLPFWYLVKCFCQFFLAFTCTVLYMYCTCTVLSYGTKCTCWFPFWKARLILSISQWRLYIFTLKCPYHFSNTTVYALLLFIHISTHQIVAVDVFLIIFFCLFL